MYLAWITGPLKGGGTLAACGIMRTEGYRGWTRTSSSNVIPPDNIFFLRLPLCLTISKKNSTRNYTLHNFDVNSEILNSTKNISNKEIYTGIYLYLFLNLTK